MGLAYKENVADTRESPVSGIVEGLSELFVVAGRWRGAWTSLYVPGRIN
jgi:hypothetical protein